MADRKSAINRKSGVTGNLQPARAMVAVGGGAHHIAVVRARLLLPVLSAGGAAG
jgi:hypothetical protein